MLRKSLAEKKILKLLEEHGMTTENKQIDSYIRAIWKQGVKNLDKFLESVLEYIAGTDKEPRLKIADKEKFAVAFPMVEEFRDFSDWFIGQFAFYCGLYGDLYVSYGIGEDRKELLMEKVKTDRAFFIDLIGEEEMNEFELKRIFDPIEDELLEFKVFEKRSEIADKLDDFGGIEDLQGKLERILTQVHYNRFSKWYRF